VGETGSSFSDFTVVCPLQKEMRKRERERESEPGWAACVGISYNFFCFVVLGFELGAYTSSHSSSPFVSGIFEIGS
jgi:hypothetical protein